MFAAASRAVTVRRLAPVWRTMPLAVQLVVPVAVPLPPRGFAHVTCVTPTASEAVPPRASAELLAGYVGGAGGGGTAPRGGGGAGFWWGTPVSGWVVSV